MKRPIAFFVVAGIVQLVLLAALIASIYMRPPLPPTEQPTEPPPFVTTHISTGEGEVIIGPHTSIKTDRSGRLIIERIVQTDEEFVAALTVSGEGAEVRDVDVSISGGDTGVSIYAIEAIDGSPDVVIIGTSMTVDTTPEPEE